MKKHVFTVCQITQVLDYTGVRLASEYCTYRIYIGVNIQGNKSQTVLILSQIASSN